jgi:hypothetical protein
MRLSLACLSCDGSFIVLVTVTELVNYDCKTFIVQAIDIILKVSLIFVASLPLSPNQGTLHEGDGLVPLNSSGKLVVS